MSMYAFAVASFTPGSGTADNASLTTLTYMALQGGTSTQQNAIEEVALQGLAASTAPMIMLLGRDSTVMATPTALSTPNSNGLLDATGGVLTNVAVGAIDASTQPKRSNSVTLAKETIAFNAYGGIIVRNWANTKDRMTILGNTASLGEASLSSFTGSTGSAAMSGTIIYETL